MPCAWCVDIHSHFHNFSNFHNNSVYGRHQRNFIKVNTQTYDPWVQNFVRLNVSLTVFVVASKRVHVIASFDVLAVFYAINANIATLRTRNLVKWFCNTLEDSVPHFSGASAITEVISEPSKWQKYTIFIDFCVERPILCSSKVRFPMEFLKTVWLVMF